MTFQFNNLQDEDHIEMDQLRTDHNISKILGNMSLVCKKNYDCIIDIESMRSSKPELMLKIVKKLLRRKTFTNPSGKRGAVASLGGGAMTKSKSNGGDTVNHSMCYHHQGFSKNCSIPLKSKLKMEQLWN